MSRLLLDDKGVEGIPLKLIIVLVILAITIPAVWKGLEAYDRSQTESNLRLELDFLAVQIKQVYLAGLGNAYDAELDIKEGMMTQIDWIEIGDSEDGAWSSIRFKLDYKSSDFILITNPHIPIVNLSAVGWGPLSLSSGRQTVHIECKEGLDFDDDGVGDMYVEVSEVSG